MRGWRPHRSAAGVRDPGSVDLWAPIASLTRRFRRTLADFPAAPQRLRPDPKRVEHWRCQLGEGPPAVGISWRSGNLTGERRREFPTLEDLRPLLAVSSVRFVNLQYGALAEELQALGEIAGRPLLDPPGIDLRNDLDDLAALACALDLLVTVPNATAQLAAAAGATVAFLGGPVSWPKLGTEAYPWHPNARSFAAEAYGRWDGPTGAVAEMVSGLSAAVK
jgi:hypothetical protein